MQHKRIVGHYINFVTPTIITVAIIIIISNVCYWPTRDNQRICNKLMFIYTCAISYSANVLQVGKEHFKLPNLAENTMLSFNQGASLEKKSI